MNMVNMMRFRVSVMAVVAITPLLMATEGADEMSPARQSPLQELEQLKRRLVVARGDMFTTSSYDEHLNRRAQMNSTSEARHLFLEILEFVTTNSNLQLTDARGRRERAVTLLEPMPDYLRNECGMNADATQFAAVVIERLSDILKKDDLEPWAHAAISGTRIELMLELASLDEKPSWQEIRRLIDELAQSPVRSPSQYYRIEKRYTEFLAAFDVELAKQQLAKFAEYKDPVIVSRLPAWHRLVEMHRTPFELSFTDMDGRSIDLNAYRGKILLLDFWATWCGPCIAELPNVKEVYDTFALDGFAVVGVSLDDAETATDRVRGVCERAGISWPQFIAGGNSGESKWKEELDISGVPATLLLDESGLLIGTNVRGAMLKRLVKFNVERLRRSK